MKIHESGREKKGGGVYREREMNDLHVCHLQSTLTGRSLSCCCHGDKLMSKWDVR